MKKILLTSCILTALMVPFAGSVGAESNPDYITRMPKAIEAAY
ncbi:hypothetical protein [Jeotgalibacillus soli]|nr:hypothetical protein [Jeotgalibacillus soli]